MSGKKEFFLQEPLPDPDLEAILMRMSVDCREALGNLPGPHEWFLLEGDDNLTGIPYRTSTILQGAARLMGGEDWSLLRDGGKIKAIAFPGVDGPHSPVHGEMPCSPEAGTLVALEVFFMAWGKAEAAKGA